MSTTKVQSDMIETFAGKNLIINGDMAIAQRGTSFAAATNEYTLDRWKYHVTGAGAVTVTQDTDVPNNTFGFSLKVDVTTADDSLASGDRYRLQYAVEGFDAAQLSFGTADAKTITVSFWVKSPKTGQHSIFLANSAWDRFYPASYSVSSADTWEEKSVTIAGDTSGTWVGATNGIGLYLAVILAIGSTYHGTVDAWNAGQAYGDASNINIMDNTANNFFITGIQLEVGSAASDFEHRDYASELARCSRYFFQYNQNTGPYQREHWGTHNVSTTQSDVAIQYPVAMRTAPTFSTGASVDDWRINGASCSAIPATVNVIHEAACRVRFTVASGLILNEAAFIDARVAGAKLVFSAEF